LRSLRPLIGASCPADIDKVISDFAAELDAIHYALGIIQHTSDGDVLRWLCEDARCWWEAFRPEFSPLIATTGWRTGQMRVAWRTLDDDPFFPASDELQRLGPKAGCSWWRTGCGPATPSPASRCCSVSRTRPADAMPMRS